jgi:hypothetical protein
MNGNSEKTALVLRIFMRLVNVRSVVIDFAYCQCSEFFTIVIPTHKESSILDICEANSGFFLWRNILPIGIVIRPPSLELSFSPWVSKLDDPMLLALEVESSCVQESVGMALDHT